MQSPEEPRPKRYRFHECAERWRPTLLGLRTLLILFVGYPLAVAMTVRVFLMEDEHAVDALQWMALIYTVLLLAYPVSKMATGLRSKWGGAPYDDSLLDDSDPLA